MVATIDQSDNEMMVAINLAMRDEQRDEHKKTRYRIE